MASVSQAQLILYLWMFTTLYFLLPALLLVSVVLYINLFENFSGYGINWTKSELMPSGSKSLSLIHHLPFKISSQTITCIRSQSAREFSSLSEANYSPLVVKLQTVIQFWIGRMNTIKIIFLPKLHYLFH